jgi:ammonium transporter, Amt family
VTFMSQVAGTALGVVIALAGGFLIYGGLRSIIGLRLDAEAEYNGADIAIHRISATPERDERA